MLATHLCVPVIAALASAFQVPSPRETGGVVRLAGHVKSFDVTSDGRRAVFLTDSATAGMQELYSVRTDGSHAPTRLNQDVLSRVFDYRISPNGSKVAFLGDRDVLGSLQLFVVPSDGSAPPIELSGPLPTGGGAYRLQFSPDGSRIVYLARQDSVVNTELYSVLTDGSAPPVRLHGPLPGSIDLYVDTITPDGTKVAYFAPIATDPFQALFASPIDGSAAPVQVGVGDPPDTFTCLQVAKGSDFAVFKVRPPSSSLVSLYSAPLDGSSVPLLLGQHVVDFQITPDDAHAVFRAGNPYPSLYSRPVGGGAAVELSDTNGVDNRVQAYAVTPDGSRVLYIADQLTLYRWELFSVPAAGGASTRISQRFVQPGGGTVEDVRVDPTGARAVYIARSGTPLPKEELFSVPVSGGNVVRISDQMAGGRGIVYAPPRFPPTVAIHPLGDEVLYLADHDVEEVFELYRGPIDGSAPPQKVNGALVTGGDVQPGFRYCGDRQVLFRADASIDGDYELFATRSRVLRTQ